MTTTEFIASLEPHSSEPLEFLAAGTRVTGAYHVTEFKAIAVNAMDCGGRAASWNELVMQVLPPTAYDGGKSMTVGKFLSIYRRVAANIALPPDALVRVEYAEADAGAISYPVDAIAAGPHSVTVELTEPTVACKASGLRVGNVPTVAARTAAIGGSIPMAPQAAGCCGTASSETAPSSCCA